MTNKMCLNFKARKLLYAGLRVNSLMYFITPFDECYNAFNGGTCTKMTTSNLDGLHTGLVE